jgi:hypothetical protein
MLAELRDGFHVLGYQLQAAQRSTCAAAVHQPAAGRRVVYAHPLLTTLLLTPVTFEGTTRGRSCRKFYCFIVPCLPLVARTAG